jgi:hypothetical protein
MPSLVLPLLSVVPQARNKPRYLLIFLFVLLAIALWKYGIKLVGTTGKRKRFGIVLLCAAIPVSLFLLLLLYVLWFFEVMGMGDPD